MVESSIPALLREHASLRPDVTAYTFVDFERDWDGIAESLTWSQLYRRTSNLAHELRQRGSTGDRAVILVPQGLDYIVSFLASLQAGLMAVPLSVPYGGAHDERTISVLADTSPAVLLTCSSVVDNVTPYVQPGSGTNGPSILEVDLLDLDAQERPGGPGSSAGHEAPETVYLQYTSGSTRTPAGVMVSNENVFANFEQLVADFFGEFGRLPPDTTIVSWLPFYHDMGFVMGILVPILAGVRAELTSPVAFLQRPARWMHMLASNTRAASAGPNFAYDIAARKTSDDDMAGFDLSRVHCILSGSERVQPATLKRFADRFAPFNLDPAVLRPAYGMAETTVYIATRTAGEPPKVVDFDTAQLPDGHAERCETDSGTPLVSYGTVDTQLLRIVDPDTSIECPAGTVGEIWVHGPNVACGYWQKPEETRRTFGATIVSPTAGTPASPWLRTGDSGFRFEGELFILGRIKDLLIVYGRNHSADDVEATISEITRGRCVAIAAPDEDGVEKPVAIIELKKRDESEDAAMQRMGTVRRDVTAAVMKSHGLSMADLVLVSPGSIPITTSGKVRRRECLQLYLRDEFTRLDGLVPAPKQRMVDETQVGAGADSRLAQRVRALHQQQHDLLVGVVCEQAATVLGRPTADDIDPDWAFQDLGFDSVKATELLDRLKTVTGLELSPALAFDYPTPAALANYLGQVMSGSVAAAPQVGSRAETDEPVAVVGMACRFPGGVDSAAGLWDLVARGGDAMGGSPADRGWNLAELFDPDPDAVGKTYTRAGGFLADVAGFDAEFFGISGREAQTMDPQQRLLLEVCWEALETARIEPAGLVGSQTGVFVGAWSQTYGGVGSDGAEGYALTGLSPSVASGRVAYSLGLQGPAITVDTACSSSLVAAHLACQSLRNGESALALAGGVTVMTTPAVFTEFARQRGLAVDGRCKAFAGAADGTGWGEGAAVLVLERLGDAQRNNHPVLAVIAGSAINQDGASNGLTAPNGPAQQRVITQAVANAGIGLNQVDVVEAHGTGTTLGDPIEAGALIATYGASREREHPLWLGSIKSNIGHTQAAAGVAGMIKMIEALNHDSLPPTLNVDRPSPHIDWSAGTVRLLTEPVPWPVTDHPRTAAVSSFGISGTNAHLILQQAPVSAEGPVDAAPLGEQTGAGVGLGLPIWPLSARTPAALVAQAERLHRHLVCHPDLDLSDVAYSLGRTRSHHSRRAVITASVGAADAREDMLAALDALRSGQPHPQLSQHYYLAHLRGKTVFVLPGQGGQYPGMGRELYQHHPVFADTVDSCAEALRPIMGWSVREVLCQEPGAPALDRVDVVQPVLFTMMVSLAEVLGHYGIVADAVIGHSQGEIAAAYIAGVFSLPEAARVVALRSQALSALSGAGAMASVLLSADELAPRLRSWGQELSIAAVNGPSHTIISGDPAAMEQFSAACEHDGVHFRSIAVDYASHSAQVEPLRERLLAELADLKPAPARIPLYSTVGDAFSADAFDTTKMDAEYWYRNLREPVRFHDSVVERLAAGECTFVELSPHPVLAPAITDTLAQPGGRTHSAVIITLHRDRPDQDSLATALAQLHNRGHSPSWSALYPDATTVGLPTYPFQHRSYWLAPTPAPVAEVSAPADGALWKAVDDDAVDTFAQVLGLSDAQDGASLAAVVRALRRWRSDFGLRSAANKLRYRVDWRAISPKTVSPTRPRWLVLALPEQADDVWITGLSARYAEAVDVLTVEPNELDRESLSALLTHAATRTRCDGIASFLAADERAHRDYPEISVGLLSTLRVLQAHSDSGLGIPLWVITQGAVSVSTDDGPASPSQSAAWGLGQSACLEYPDQWGGLVDLPHTATPRDIELLYGILSCAQSEDQLAIRGHGLSARRLVEASLPLEQVERASSWKPAGVALVTGATGRLGRQVIGWLAERGATPLVLLSRTAAEDPQLAQLARELEARGVDTTSVSVDVSDRSGLAAVLADIRSTYGPIRTVAHAAAAIGWNTISDTTAEEVSNSFSAKAVGANNLVELLEDEPPDTFILFSSAAATWGGVQQGTYAAANAHIDALATRLRGNGCAAVSAAYGLWADETGTMPDQIVEYLQRIGVDPIPPDTALAALEQAIEANDTLITIADVSWDRFLPAFTARRSHPLLTELAARVTTSESSSSALTASASGLRDELAGKTAEQQLQILTTMVASVTATVLTHPDSDALDPELAFKDLGIDSLTALEIRNALNQHTGLTLPVTLILDHPSPATLAAHLAELLVDTTAPVVPVAQVSTRGDEPVDNRLGYLDQAGLLALRAVHGALMQVTWVYDGAVNLEGLRQFHRNLGLGLLGRRIERSPLPFARDRWVLSPRSADIDIATTPRPRAEVGAWADERARLAIDPEWGPGWHLGVLPLEDGGSAVSLVATHTIADAIGFGLAIADAAEGRSHDLGYPPARSRTRSRAVREDLRQTIKELPSIARAFAAVARRARRDREEFKSAVKEAPPSPRAAGNDQAVDVPTLTAYIDLAEWDACAKSLGASSNSLVAGFASRLAVRTGRVEDDGTVTLRFVVSQRAEADMRGNALTNIDVAVDPTLAATDLGEMHGKITHAILEGMENADDEYLAPLPLAAITPKRVARRLTGLAGGGASVTCSNVGDVHPAMNRPDGTDADYVYVRGLEPGITKHTLECMGGRLLVFSGRGHGKMYLSISAYLLGRSNTKNELRELVSRTLAEFNLNAEIDC